MADAGMSDAAVLKATGRDWAAWKAHLDASGAADLDHAAIARSLKQEGVQPWWRQMVTVGYERMIGRRDIGQSCTGDYAAAVSRTLAGSKDTALGAWAALNRDCAEYAGRVAVSEPRITKSEKWRYWRVDLDDGSRVTVSFSDKPDEKCTVGVNHDKLPSADDVTPAKTWWKALLAQL